MENEARYVKNRLFLNSEDYKERLRELRTEVVDKCKKSDNEATVASSFENSIYYFIRHWFEIDITFDKEKNLGNSVGHIFSNKRMDAVYNNLIIEYKHKSKLKSQKDKEEAEKQTRDYLQTHLDKDIEYDAILTDGIQIKFFWIQNKKIKTTPFFNITTDAIDKIIKSLVFFDKKKLVGGNIAKDFILESQNLLSKSFSNVLFASIKNENVAGKTNMLFVEWQDLFHLSEADKGKNRDIDKRRKELGDIFNCEINDNDLEYKALFCLQTTYAVIVKLIAYKVLVQITGNENDIFDNIGQYNSNDLRRFFQQLEDNLTFKNSGIRNLLEGDFFSWYCDENQWNKEIFNKIKNIIDTLISYEDLKFSNSYEPQDLFKDLYIGIIPKSIRHSFGEYFTPVWLADSVVTRSLDFVEKDDWKGLDPTCGSGVFVIKMIEKILDEHDIDNLNSKEKQQLLKDILARAKGIDLNPLSVLTARVNYLIAISRLLDYNDDIDIEIPIYLGDSANLPQKIFIDNVECIKYTLRTQKQTIDIVLPTSFVFHADFSEIMFSLQSLVKAEQPNEIYIRIIEKIPTTERTEEIKKQIRILSENLVFLHKNKWDGIWVRIIYNFLSTIKLGKFDMIVGNPPWVKWEFLPQSYANKIKELCVDKHLFSSSVRTGGISLNICALIANTAALQWLGTSGVLAFLMPKTLMTQESYEGFRNFYLDNTKENRLFLNAVDDWSKAGHPFVTVKEKFLTYFFSRTKKDYSKGIKVFSFTKDRKVNILDINSKRNYQDVKDYFSVNEGIAIQLVPQKTSFSFVDKNCKYDFSVIIGENFYKARSGAEFTPAELYFLENRRASSKKGIHIFKNKPLRTAKHKIIPQNNLEFETDFIFPVVKGPNIDSFRWDTKKEFAVFPYDWKEQKCLTYTELRKKSPKLADYLLENKTLIEAQSERSLSLSIGNEFYSLSKIGEYTYVDCLVAFRDNTTMKACVVKPVETPWGDKKMPVCAKHAPYISMTKNKRKITLGEAYYIAGILNTAIVKEYIKVSNDSRSISIDLQIKMPEYDSNNKLHAQLSKLSKKAHLQIDNENIVDNLQCEMENLYIEICKKTIAKS
ncbi:Eco57I restriction-modification methylase domain-containing protein [Methanobacterium sp. MBAC-LM]|uniref:Eco57I restriction-modification methylase domain-containing protein n=1 Tax=Methanobacterium sp. MBAC-LM TaxID=3412034 RepID=UPI003C771265